MSWEGKFQIVSAKQALTRVSFVDVPLANIRRMAKIRGSEGGNYTRMWALGSLGHCGQPKEYLREYLDQIHIEHPTSQIHHCIQVIKYELIWEFTSHKPTLWECDL